MNLLSSEFTINAVRRAAEQSNVPITIVRRGDTTHGAMIVKINRLDGTAEVLIQSRMGDDIVWMKARPGAAMTDAEADIYIQDQGDMDPDAWLIEIEDKQGRVWFEGKVVE
jgi:hypothetical protein